MNRSHRKPTCLSSNRILAGAIMLAAAFAPATAGAQSITKVDASRLSCSAVQGIINERGAVIVRSRSLQSGRMLSDRFVSRRGFCYHNEIIRPHTIATANNDQCSVKVCTERPNSKPGR